MISVSVAYCRDRSAAVTEVRALHAIVPQSPRDQYSAPARARPGGASVDCGRSFVGWSCHVTQPRGSASKSKSSAGERRDCAVAATLVLTDRAPHLGFPACPHPTPLSPTLSRLQRRAAPHTRTPAP